MPLRPARPSALGSRLEKRLLAELGGLLADYPDADDETLAERWAEKRDYSRFLGEPDPFAGLAGTPGFERELRRLMAAARAKARARGYARAQRARARELRMSRQPATPAQLRLLKALARRYDLPTPEPLETLDRLAASRRIEAWLAGPPPESQA